MTEQELQEIRRYYLDNPYLFNQMVDRLLDEVERLKEQHEGNMEALQYWYDDYEALRLENERLRKQVEFNREYGIQSNAMKDVERLREAIEKIMTGGNSLASYVISKGIHDREMKEPQKLEYHDYEVWLCWKTMLDVRDELEKQL